MVEPRFSRENSHASSQADGWGDGGDEPGWDDYDPEDDGEGGTWNGLGDIEIPMQEQKAYTCVSSKKISQQVLAYVEELQELFEMSCDDLIAVARHFKWNQDRMQINWFD